MGPQLERLARKNKNFRVLTIDIDTWRSPVSNQYNVRQMPQVWLYEGKEKRGEYMGPDIKGLFDFLNRD